MTDEVDIANELAEVATQAAIAEIRHQGRKLYRADCRACGEDLEPHRQPYGVCIECKAREEKRAKIWGR